MARKAVSAGRRVQLTSLVLTFFPHFSQSQRILLHFIIYLFSMVYYLSLLVTGLGAGPPPLPHSSDSHQDHLVSQNSQAVFTCQGDIVKLGLEGSSLSGAVLKTLPPILIL